MKNNIIKLVCQHCGCEFPYEVISNKGSKPKYCKDCKQLLIKESKLKYVQNKRKAKEVIIDTNQYKAENDFLNYTTKMLDLLGQLDTLRVNMCNLASELGQYQSDYDRKDQEFIHQIELNNFENANDALQFVTNWHNDRTSRRNVKNIVKFLRDIISAIPMKTKFAAINTIQNIKSKEK